MRRILFHQSPSIIKCDTPAETGAKSALLELEPGLPSALASWISTNDMRVLPVSPDSRRCVSLRSRPWIFVLLVFSIAGCAEKREEITKYRVPKMAEAPASFSSVLKETQTPQQEASPAVPTKMLAAMFPQGKSTWFFKLSGPPQVISGLSDTYRKFLESVKFEAATPKWKLPAGWTERNSGNSVRFATLVIPLESGESLEVSVTRLPPNDPDLSKHLRANLDRWRGQLGLAPLGNEDPVQAMQKISVDGGTAYLADLEGMMSPDSMGSGMGSFAKGLPAKKRGFDAAPVRPKLGDLPAAPPLTYTTPSGWQLVKVSGFRKAAFEVRDGEKKVEIIASDPDLSPAARDRLANVNLWRADVDLPPITAEELPKQMQKFPVGPLTGDYVALVGPQNIAKTILGVIVDRGETTWFFKLKGDSALAAREKPNFESFVSSVKFSGTERAKHGQ